MSGLRKAVVVGAGPVGCLAAMSLARMGWDVVIIETRPDIRLSATKSIARQRSINLAISSRGIAALRTIDPKTADRFLQSSIPMMGRMIHGVHGELKSQVYDDLDRQCIYSINRALLNENLLSEVAAIPNIKTVFQHKVQSVDFERRFMSVKNLELNLDVDISFDFLIGADGSYSVVRRQLMRVARMDYQQEYLPVEYIELGMPAGRDGNEKPTFLLDQNHLHIWPRHTFMLIALPNKDNTFTCTLFAPTSEFERLSSREAILNWFSHHFPDALSLIGEDRLIEDFEKNPRCALISIKTNPYHYKDRVIILGDAAHAMVPFYGQGLNCGFEDVRVLDTLLRSSGITGPALKSGNSEEDDTNRRLADVLSTYSRTRKEDLHAICDMAIDNYLEMGHSVVTWAYTFRKVIDNVLSRLTVPRRSVAAWYGDLELSQREGEPFRLGEPQGWLPLYTMVTFRPDVRYAVAQKTALRQGRILKWCAWLGTAILGLATVGITFLTLSREPGVLGGWVAGLSQGGVWAWREARLCPNFLTRRVDAFRAGWSLELDEGT